MWLKDGRHGLSNVSKTARPGKKKLRDTVSQKGKQTSYEVEKADSQKEQKSFCVTISKKCLKFMASIIFWVVSLMLMFIIWGSFIIFAVGMVEVLCSWNYWHLVLALHRNSGGNVPKRKHFTSPFYFWARRFLVLLNMNSLSSCQSVSHSWGEEARTFATATKAVLLRSARCC